MRVVNIIILLVSNEVKRALVSFLKRRVFDVYNVDSQHIRTKGWFKQIYPIPIQTIRLNISLDYCDDFR